MRAARMHADEIATDVDLVRRLVTGQFPEWAGLPLRPVPSSGTVNALYRLGADMVVRLPRLHWADGDVHKEYQWLPRLAPLLPVTIPAPLAKGKPAEGYPCHWSVYRWLDGENPHPDHLPDPDLLAADLAGFVTALRRMDPTDAPPSYHVGPLTKEDTRTRAAIGELRGRVDVDRVSAAWEAALEAPGWAGPPVWLHTDLMPGNLLMAGGRLSAVLDFGGLSVGDPARDLIVAWNLLPAPARSVFRAALDVDEATWARGRGWALSKALLMLPYYWNTNPTLVANARHVVGEILADHGCTA